MHAPNSMIRAEDYPDVPVSLVADFERARKQLAGIKPSLRYAYVTGRAQGMRHDEAVLYVQRLWSVRRRWATDAKRCHYCGHPVLWRHEGRRRVNLNRTGLLHACPEDDRS